MIHPIAMETQAHMEMSHREIQPERTKEPAEEITEEQFLKDLYLFMKKRDTPIERIPNLGFKQIDLFVMFKVVRDLGGYHQVTAQQLWKQVYNTLGGNPRSTSAATCTRRHYEKLLLPYECHVTGILVNVLPRNQSKHFHYASYSYSKEHDDGQRAAKRKLLSMPLLQNHCNLQRDLHDSVFPLPPHYPPYYHPSHAVLPPHIPLPPSVLAPHSSPAPKPWFPFPPTLNPVERVKEPLEQLRFLAEQYKTTTRLSEPLNLSIKESKRETNSNPASSFTTPSSSKNPKFLNKPSPLYTAHRPQAVRNGECETQDGDDSLAEAPYSYPAKAREAYVVDVKPTTAPSSPTYDSAPTRTDEGAAALPQKPSSPQIDLTIEQKEETEGSPAVRELNLGHILPSIPQEKGGKMEIEVPLSVFHNWLRLCGSSAMMPGAKQPPIFPPQGEHSEQRNCSDADVLPTGLTFHTNPKHRSSSAEDLRLMHKNLPSPIATTQSTGNHQSINANPSHFTTYKPLPSGGPLKNAVTRDVYPCDIKSYVSNPVNYWDAYNKDTQASPIPMNSNSNPCTVQQDFASSTSYNVDSLQGGKEKSDTVPSAVLMLNSNSTSLLHLTSEEVMKLKKIISSSL